MLRILLMATLFLAACGASAEDAAPAGSPVGSGESGQTKDGYAGAVNSYDECVAAGYVITKSLPPQCHTPDGRVFVKTVPLPGLLPEAPVGGGACRNLCGDGTCQEIVCMALGCPCAESPASCPEDCR